MGYKVGTGKTGRFNPKDARYSPSFNKTGRSVPAVPLCGWANDLLSGMAAKARMTKGECLARLIEKAANGATAVVIAFTLGMMMAECFDK